MKLWHTIFYKSGNKVHVETSNLKVNWASGLTISWESDGNIMYISADDIDAIVKGKQ